MLDYSSQNATEPNSEPGGDRENKVESTNKSTMCGKVSSLMGSMCAS